MKRLVFSTNNAHKLEEVSAILGNDFEVLGLRDIGINEDIPETGKTLEENAFIKASYIYEKKKCDCFADDTGLEVEALDNAPGVYSARYAGEQCCAKDNVEKLLSELEGVENRKARFRTVIAAIIDGKKYSFEGIIKGVIINTPKGEAGFGYDPVFMPDGYDKTFAELGNDIKNKISHRALAVKELDTFLKNR
ncbi:non-canonical purine NTP diphosphatase [Dysgonomonas sp. 216]|uniref:non-canonical purine NTP diphosphatase n=1 Tax=Dysgonomonas sp. 216 TaxID=2302934 RepID=UPI0013D2C676|nr:non-canonical purine NTP diphosphatase [Dysgonomonas sp. 216]NDW18330.1 non-canonical purine NTP diphosphatase [Dysgonomonas sp. 216]NDW18698.1 non-canonical purine NTP diphosphatase [Dysgonomonas sp. 216]